MGRVSAEGDSALAENAGLTFQWVQKWKRLDESPKDRTMTRPLVRYLAKDSPWDVLALEDWLLDANGLPPQPELWTAWCAARDQVRAREAAEKRTAPIAPVIPRPNPRGAAAKHPVKRRRTG